MFNPRLEVQVLPLFDGHECQVSDDALQDPQRWVERACQQHALFSLTGHA